MAYDIIIGRNKSDKEKFGDKGLIYLGKGYVSMGNYTSLSNLIWLDVIRSHVILIAGKRGSGKSYSIGVIAEELSDLPSEIKNNIASLIFDTMGIFWTMKFKNEKDAELLDEWKLKPKNLPINTWVPLGYFEEFEKRGIPVNRKFALGASELEIEDWLSIFNLQMTEPISILIQRTLAKFSRNENFDLDEIINKIRQDSESEEQTKRASISLFEAAKSWKVFASKNQEATKINDLIQAGITSVLDLSVYSSISSFDIRALIIGLISKKLFSERMLARKKEEIESIEIGFSKSKKDMPLVWLFVDECHEFLPANEKTPATNSLIQLLREGRQPGISLVLATQQPGVIHRDVMTQSDIIISHRLTNKKDMEALNEIMQTYLLEGIKKSMNNLPNEKGSAIVLDDNSERLYSIRVRPRFTWHGGETPTAVREKEKI
ncbi:MAG: DUF87 domain-containing protein [Nanoarchaeota archaeon]